MQTPDKIKVPFASGTGALKSSIPDAGSTTDETASMEMGFPPRTMSTDTDKIAPTGQDFNGILNKITTGLQYLQAGACYPYDSAFATAIGGYPIGAMVLNTSDGSRWVNTIANNTSDPDNGGEGWKKHDIASNGVMFGSTSGTANAIVLDVDGFTNAVDGMLVGFRALGANTTQVTLKIGDNTPVSICKGANKNLLVSDIGGAGYMVLVQYSETLNKWVLLNPSKGINYASSRSIFEVFYTMRKDPAPLNGAYDCNGAEYSADDFTGSDNPYDLLVAGKASTCTYVEYDAEVAEKGSCAKFGLDTANQKFKVPTLTNILQPTVLASAIGEICDAGLPNITANLICESAELAGSIVEVTARASKYTISSSGNGVRGDSKFDASISSPIYRDDINTVQPQTIYARAMVQLATAGQEVSIQQYEQQLSDYARTNTINGRLIGEIIQSALPLTDAGVHLLDGSQIQKSGVYTQFCTYVANLQEDYPDLFCTEAEFTASVEAYGSCGKFVNGASYIRLPKVSDILQGTTDLSAVGDLVEAGLPNITGNLAIRPNVSDTASGAVTVGDGAFSLDVHTRVSSGSISPTTVNPADNVSFNANRANKYYRDDIEKPTPQTIKSLLYICVATSVKTPVEVEIDEVITDLNAKLNNGDNYGVTPKIDSQKIVSGEFVSSNLTIRANSDASTTEKTYSLANYLPNDGYVYEVLIQTSCATQKVSGQAVTVRLSTDICSVGTLTGYAMCYGTAQGAVDASTTVLPVGTGRTISSVSDIATGVYSLTAKGYRRLYKA